MLQHPTAAPLLLGAAYSRALLSRRDGLGSPVPRSLPEPAEPMAAELGSRRAAMGGAASMAGTAQAGRTHLGTPVSCVPPPPPPRLSSAPHPGPAIAAGRGGGEPTRCP